MPQESSTDKKLCFISKDAEGDTIKAYIRADVCHHLPADYLDHDGNYYCVLHFPNDNKHNDTNFESVVKDKLDHSQYFQHVYFPGGGVLRGRTFKHDVNFNHAVFSSDAYFGNSEFKGRATFVHTSFKDKADFSGVKFSQEVEFNSTDFNQSANFESVQFSANAKFLDANFLNEADFGAGEFFADADFSDASFMGDASFDETIFHGSGRFFDAKFFKLANFAHANFKDAKFTSVTFAGKSNFFQTQFQRADYEKANFDGESNFLFSKFDFALFIETTFSANVDFGSATFEDVRFYKATFAKDTFFDVTEFNNNVSFNSAVFGSESYVIFRDAFFAGKADFRYCTAEGYLIFSNPRQSKESSFEFQHAVFEKASRISFHTVDLHPSWFVNIDSRKFVFTDIFWIDLNWDFWNKRLNREIDSLEGRGIKDEKKRLFEIAARQLAVNAEENNRYEEAAKFRYMAMETRRLEETKQFNFSRYLIWLYKWTSGYGESWTRAALVLLAVILFFGALYASPLSTFDYGADQFRWMFKGEGLVHSLSVAAFQRPEPKAADTLTKFFIILETIFAPLQAALLALAIRRKFMR